MKLWRLPLALNVEKTLDLAKFCDAQIKVSRILNTWINPT